MDQKSGDTNISNVSGGTVSGDVVWDDKKITTIYSQADPAQIAADHLVYTAQTHQERIQLWLPNCAVSRTIRINT